MKVLELLVVAACLLNIRGVAGSNPCSSYSDVNDADRARSYRLETEKTDAKDLEAGHWYRFSGNAGEKLGQKSENSLCPSKPMCGTSMPGNMRGSNPRKAGKMVTRYVCFSDGSNCCRYKVKIFVKRCPKGFLVFQLPHLPIGSPYRYCGNRKTKVELVYPTTLPHVKKGEDKDHPGKSCKDIKDENPEASSGVRWIQLTSGKAFQVYCDQETDEGGWTLVYSYTFTNYQNYVSGTNAVNLRPTWPAEGDIPESRTVPLSETQWGAMDFILWKQIGHVFMAKSNINNWISCSEGNGSLVQYRAGTMNCHVAKAITPVCEDIAPDEIRLLTKEAAGNYGPHLYYSKSPTWLRTYYYWESSTQTPNWPTHDPCGRNGLSHLENVPNPHGNIYIR